MFERKLSAPSKMPIKLSATLNFSAFFACYESGKRRFEENARNRQHNQANHIRRGHNLKPVHKRADKPRDKRRIKQNSRNSVDVEKRLAELFRLEILDCVQNHRNENQHNTDKQRENQNRGRRLENA